MRAEGRKLFTQALLARDKTGMRLLHRTIRVALVQPGTRRYYPEQLIQRMLNQRKHWQYFSGGGLRADQRRWTPTGSCGWRARPWWPSTMRARAGTPQCMMLASVHSEDDMVYERKVYM